MNNWQEKYPEFFQYPLKEQIHLACDAFDVAWRKGERPEIEDYLRCVDESNRAALLRELLLIEFKYRRKMGEMPAVSEYFEQFPKDAKTINQAFDSSDQKTVDISTNADVDTDGNQAFPDTFDSGQHASGSNESTHMSDIRSKLGEFGEGRYTLVRVLGEGAFGRVYLATDNELRRQVAIKVPTSKRFKEPEDAKVYLAEARTVASLDHTHIVPVYDVGRHDDGSIYVVSKFIQGCTLAELIQSELPALEMSVELITKLATALDHAHQRRLIHRDIKPGNILIEEPDGIPYLTDFGLAIREEDYLSDSRIAGTPAYMSPEQARGEGHRLDGRSDIFSLGVILYELLTGKRPFRGGTPNELMHQVITAEPTPPRQMDESIPVELERICLKSLEKRVSDRYANATEFVDDLEHWQSGTQQSAAPTTIHPKGLRSFDADDADFFLELLPGARTRDGIPSSVQFWKQRIEVRSGEKRLDVGMIYGPSGCGKSSLVQAGIIPLLSADVIPIFVEATPDETELRILRALRKQVPDLPTDMDLVETFAYLRREQGCKVVIFVDQFEQWLHAKSEVKDTEMVNAFRQCDGEHLQVIVMVRDDFWLAVSRFMSYLEVDLIQGHNIALVDLFDIDHAEKLLVKFGQAFGKLPANPSKFSNEQREFIERVASGLARDGKVVSVRLTLFTEMIKSKRWDIATLDEVGGTQGIGVSFLEETFSTRTANPKHRLHQEAAKEVLKVLLPEVGTNIKGHMRSHAELIEASGYQNRMREFNELMRILDGELRLITPTDPEGSETKSESDPNSKFFQLTHDYLVPALREWLTWKQQETRKGRAEIRLAERASLWNAKQEDRHLPSWWETMRIQTLTDSGKWTPPQRAMMAKSIRFHGMRTAVLLLLFVGVVWGAVAIRQSIVAGNQEARAHVIIEDLPKAEISQVPEIVSELDSIRDWADPMLKVKIDEASGSQEKLYYSLALLPVDSDQIEYLAEQLPVCPLDQFPVIRDALLPYKARVVESLWEMALNEETQPDVRFQSSAALATYSPEDERWTKTSPFVAEYLTASTSLETFAFWRDQLEPGKLKLTKSFSDIYRASHRSPSEREAAVLVLAQYWRNQPNELIDAILLAEDSSTFTPLIKSLTPQAEKVKNRLLDEVNAELSSKLDRKNQNLSANDVRLRDQHWKRQAIAAVALFQLGFTKEVWPLLELRPNPSLRSFVIEFLGRFGSDQKTLAAQLDLAEDVSVRRSLIQSLGGLDPSQISASDRRQIAKQLKELYIKDPDSGIHSSASWTLNRWGESLPELPVGEPTPTASRASLIEMLNEKLDSLKAQVKAAEADIASRQAMWERQLQSHLSPSTKSLDDGLVAHFRFDETEGERASNAIKGQPDGVYAGSGQPTWTAGVIGNAAGLDGKGGHFVCGEAFDPERSDTFSYGCWCLPEPDGKYVLLGKMDDDNQYRGFDLWLAHGRVGMHLTHHESTNDATNDNRAKVLAKEAFRDSRWRHLLVTYDGSSKTAGMSVFIDGRKVATEVDVDQLEGTIRNDSPLHIGMRARNFPFKGAIDDLRIYDRRLQEVEVKKIYDAGVKSLVAVPAEDRTPPQELMLAAAFRSQDEVLQDLESQRRTAEKELHRAKWEKMRRWYVNSQGQTFCLFPPSAAEGDTKLDHGVAIASREVTLDEFRRFAGDHRVERPQVPTGDCPVHFVSWYEAAAYCNWLSAQDRIPEDQWVYQPNKSGQYSDGMLIRENALQLSGYRLPTSKEWELTSRAGTNSTYVFGESIDVIGNYAHYMVNSGGRSHPVGSLLPNAAGLHDVHGNINEWLQISSSAAAMVLSGAERCSVRGGGFNYAAEKVRIGYSVNLSPGGNGLYDVGFRTARTFKVSAKGGNHSKTRLMYPSDPKSDSRAITNILGMDLKLVATDEANSARLKPAVLIGICEVTNDQYAAVMRTDAQEKPVVGDPTKDDARLPVTNVSWIDAVTFCNRLSELEGMEPYYLLDEENESIVEQHSSGGYRLPTDEEFEIAAYTNGHGKSQPAALNNAVWYVENSGNRKQPGRQLQANSLELYDTIGNVWEYVESPGVSRGGSFDTNANALFEKKRNRGDAKDQAANVGFRVVLDIDRGSDFKSKASKLESQVKQAVKDGDPNKLAELMKPALGLSFQLHTQTKLIYFKNTFSKMGDMLSTLSEALARQGKNSAAERVGRESVYWRERSDKNFWGLYYSKCVLAESLSRQKKFAEAAALFATALPELRERQSSIPSRYKHFHEEAEDWFKDHQERMAPVELDSTEIPPAP